MFSHNHLGKPLSFSTSAAKIPDLRELLCRLPAFDLRDLLLGREADYYGASRLISERLDIPFPPISRSSWTHGWNFQKIWEVAPGVPVEVLISNGSCKLPHIVQSQELADFLISRGCDKVVAGGLPYMYTSPSRVQRIEGSLLVMPPHVTADTCQDWDEEEYVSSIAGLSKHFSTMVACISGFCVSKGYWTKTFEKYGIPWISGAITHDQNALKRMRAIFDSFEYMTTNEIGSHVLYAAYSGCKISLWGPEVKRRRSYFAKDQFWLKFPQILDLYLGRMCHDSIFERYPLLRSLPHQAEQHLNWAQVEIGESCRKKPEVMAVLLGWEWKRGEDEAFMRQLMHSKTVKLMKPLYHVERKLLKILRK